MATLYIAVYESRSFMFRALGVTKSVARETLMKGLHLHTEQYQWDADWFNPDEIYVQPMRIGAAYRDYDEI